MNQIRAFLEGIAPISDSEWDFFSSKLEKVSLNKKQVLLRKGQVENHLTFIVKGIVRLFIPGDPEITFGFVFENEFVTAYDSFLTRMPSEYQIETLNESLVFRIANQDLQEVYSYIGNGNLIGRKMAENMFLIKSKRELSLLMKTAEERYLDLFTDRPNLFKHIPLKYLASYIGVTPQALSRIRKRIS